MADNSPIDFLYSDGTITLTQGSDIAVGQFTSWDPAVLPFDLVILPGSRGISIVAEVIDATHIRLPKPWPDANLVASSYAILRWIKHTDPRIYGVRVSDYLTKLRSIPDDAASYVSSLNVAAQALAQAAATFDAVKADVDEKAAAVAGAATEVLAAAATVTQAATAIEALSDGLEQAAQTASTAAQQAVLALANAAGSLSGEIEFSPDVDATHAAATVTIPGGYDPGGFITVALNGAPLPRGKGYTATDGQTVHIVGHTIDPTIDRILVQWIKGPSFPFDQAQINALINAALADGDPGGGSQGQAGRPLRPYVFKGSDGSLPAGHPEITIPDGYTVGSLEAHLGGLKLIHGDDFDATNGTTIKMTGRTMTSRDVLEVTVYSPVVSSGSSGGAIDQVTFAQMATAYLLGLPQDQHGDGPRWNADGLVKHF